MLYLQKSEKYNNVEILRDKNAEEKFYAAKKPITIQDVNVDNIVISKLLETKTNSKYLIGYLDKLKMEIKIKTVN